MSRRLLLPLHCYDEGGVIKPPKWFYWLLLCVCIDWVVVIFSLALREHTTLLLNLFYPNRQLLVIQLLVTVPFIITLLLLGNRGRLWRKGWGRWSKAIMPLMFTGIALSFVSTIWQLNHRDWEFALLQAYRLVLNLLLGLLLLRSLHIGLMLSDWRHINPDTAK
ncbi:DUF2919 domain-containing protein [Alteromonas ponticola]|uniref:DUF2919 domain-containing protein n=1 Tax=Alteromonas aquimaris TaxID=2998417 RepID=A0ABT3P7P5_9ALTE|nr:DUF2919 family protein [Alteromonas aquimaris]MCW8108570.1 DUF2919 domain-containing protein [Alteromonas aquimaris]